MGPGNRVGQVWDGCGGGLGVRRLEVGPCGRVRRVEVDKGSVYFTPGFRSIREEEDLISRWGKGEDPVRIEACFCRQ